MLSVAETLALILSRAAPLEPERVPLAQALHRVLREEAQADADFPRGDTSAMDGYALRRAEAGGLLRVIGEIPAGADGPLEIGPGECARIFTGGRVPLGADCVAMQEEVERAGDFIRLTAENSATHIRRRGESYSAGDTLLRPGDRLGPLALSLLASCGVGKPLVTRAARVVHLATGDELVAPEEIPREAQVRDSNSTLLGALLAEAGGQLVVQQRVGDSLGIMETALAAAPDDFDVLLLSGGASVGDHDFTRPLLKAAGFEIHLEKVNLRPGKPLVFATRGRQLAFGLPGNPVSHWVLFQLFLVPLFASLSGESTPRRPQKGRLVADFSLPASPRETWWPAFVQEQEGASRLQPLRFLNSGDLAGLAGANALFRVAPGCTHFSAAELLEFIPCQP